MRSSHYSSPVGAAVGFWLPGPKPGQRTAPASGLGSQPAWGWGRGGAGEGLKEPCPPRPESGHPGFRQQAQATGWDGGRRGQQHVSDHPSHPGNYLHNPGSPGVTAWTKARRGCQLVLVACAFRSLLPDQRHTGLSLHAARCSTNWLTEALTLSCPEPRARYSGRGIPRGLSFSSPHPRPSNVGKSCSISPVAARGAHAHPRNRECPHLHAFASPVFRHSG